MPDRPSSTRLPKTPEQPLSGTALTLLVVSATAVMALFYLGLLLSLLGIGGLLLLELAGAVVLLRFGLTRYMVGPIRAQTHLAGLILRGLSLKWGPEYQMPLPREEGPRLYAVVEQIAERARVPPPDRVVLEMNAGAWVRLRGYRRGRGHCTLGVGYDMLAVLAEDELEAVIAHEMAHAKLIQRGYKGWLANAVARSVRLSGALGELRVAAKESGKRFWTAELLARGARFLCRRGTRLFAAYSRQDEFAADRAAAELCGTGPCRRALMTLHGAGRNAGGLAWRDRRVQADRGERLSEWVRERLLPRNEDERREREAQARNDARRGDFDTHPSMADRLAALPDEGAADSDRPPAIGLLRDPEALGLQLIAEIERIANEQQRKHSQEAHRRIRKKLKGRQLSPAQSGAAVLIAAGLFFGFLSLSELMGADIDSSVGPMLGLGASLAAIGGGVILYRKYPYREPIVLPVPAWSPWTAAMEAETRERVRKEPLEPLEAELRAGLPASVKTKRARARYWSVEGYRALQRCDYGRALIAGRLSLEANPRCLEGALGRGIAAAYYGQAKVAHQMLGWAARTHGLGTSVSWGLSWGLALLGDWSAAEAYLLDAAARCPDQATVRSLLGMCQWQLGKLEEAAESVRQAAALEPGEPRHRILRARIRLASGRAREALQELESVEAAAGTDFHALLAGVSANLLLGCPEEAAHRAALLEQAHPGPRTLLALAQAYGDAEQYDAALPLLEQVGAGGFYPEACVGLARIAFERKQLDQARAHLLAALDLTQALGPGARGPLEFLETAARGLIAMGEPVEGCQAWRAKLDLSASPAPARQLTLLVCAPTQAAAREQVRELYRAMHPGHELSDAQLSWEPVEPEHQPEGEVVPGVYGHQFE
jgi:Zn-dependent protease with chaperone function/Tfp pilus assembly protein PilF